eukprot:TRINITY_DN65329_c0_g1_i1.p1 TRINITY_DN65329_c0_g1~~TRINITY_DN65329_c0_g1_i1.p1  ORF type:complete len:308 (-),score=62.63 TRINITY_DN65329_c0_g1_i1:385-1308(-)
MAECCAMQASAPCRSRSLRLPNEVRSSSARRAVRRCLGAACFVGCVLPVGLSSGKDAFLGMGAAIGARRVAGLSARHATLGRRDDPFEETDGEWVAIVNGKMVRRPKRIYQDADGRAIESQGFGAEGPGRDGTQEAESFLGALSIIPLMLAGFAAIIVYSGYVRFGTGEARIPVSTSLDSLIEIENDYYAAGASSGVRQKVSKWYKSADLVRRVKFEVEDVKEPQKSKVVQLAKDCTEDIATMVEYFGYSTGIDEYRENGYMADKIAKQRAADGDNLQQEFAGKALTAGRQALQEAVKLLDEAHDSR